MDDDLNLSKKEEELEKRPRQVAVNNYELAC
jgi:hypothetical protein